MLPVEAKSFSFVCTIVCYIEFYSKKRILVLGYQPIAEGTREPTVKSLYWEKTHIWKVHHIRKQVKLNKLNWKFLIK